MKKLYYGIYNGEIEVHRNGEAYMLTISSSAETVDEAMESITGETGGNCFGPNESYDEGMEWLHGFLEHNLKYFEDMDSDEEQERIKHLADEWKLNPEELEYLR